MPTFDIVTKDIKSILMNQPRVLIAIDGVDGSGKSMFAQKLHDHLALNDIRTLCVSIDGFHNKRDVRYQRGPKSPEGFFLDSYDYNAFINALIKPYKQGRGAIVTAIHDVGTDQQLPQIPVAIEGFQVLIIEGIFLHRDELRDYWDYSLFLDVPFTETYRRMSLRDGCPLDPADPANARYYLGQQLYFRQCRPKQQATHVINNSDYTHPIIIDD